MLRVPEEPDTSKYPGQGVVIPLGPDFHDKAKHSPAEWNKKVQDHTKELLVLGLDLCHLGGKYDNENLIEEIESSTATVAVGETSYDLEIKAEKVKVAGVPDETLIGVRHSVVMPIRPDRIWDAINRLNYTDAIEDYSYLVENLENFSKYGDEDKSSSALTWKSVSYTATKIGPPILLSAREFVCYDHSNDQHKLFFSRSCLHPLREVTKVPGMLSFWDTSRRYRVPLMFFHKVTAVDGDPNSSLVVQFQYSDIGGIVPIKEQVKAVIKMGMENFPKVFEITKQAEEQGVELGEKSDLYMKNPLLDGRPTPEDMFPGLKM